MPRDTNEAVASAQQYSGAAPRVRIGLSCLALAVAAAGARHLQHHYGRYVVDDAYVTFRYARNFVRGIGLVYNPGDYVKGYSNTLWTLLSVLPEWAGADPIHFAQNLGAAAYLSLFGLSYFLGRDAHGRPTLTGALYVPALLASFAPLAGWHVAGLETGLFSGLLLAGLVARVHEQRHGGSVASALIFALAAISRPEGIAFFAAMALHDAFYRTVKGQWRQRDLLFYLVPPACYGIELLASKLYYGQFFPQTFYAKVSQASGLVGNLHALAQGLAEQCKPGSYTRRGFDAIGLGELALALAAVALLSRARRRLYAGALIFILVQVVFVARAKGDWMPMYRFCVPMLPFVAVLVGGGIGALGDVVGRSGHARHVASLLALSLVLFRVVPANQALATGRRSMSAGKQLQFGAEWRRLGPPGVSLGAFDIGGRGYAGGFVVVDTGGLTEPWLARCTPQDPRCAHYAKLAAPKIVQVHPAGLDGYLMTSVARPGHYLEWRAARPEAPSLLVAPELLFTARLPNAVGMLGQARPDREPDARANGECPLVSAIELPSHGRPGAPLRATLYWNRGAEVPSGKWSRQLLWRGPDGAVPAQETPPAFASLRKQDAWMQDHYLVDHAELDAPALPGAYELWAKSSTAQESQKLADFVVVSSDEIKTVTAELIDGAQRLNAAGRLPRAVAMARTASLLSDTAPVRDAHQRLAIELSQLAASASSMSTGADPSLARLRRLQASQSVLLQELGSGTASTMLRNAIDENAEKRRLLIDKLMAEHSGTARK